MKSFFRNAERFFLRNRDRGIRNLMLYIAIGNALVYLLMLIDPSNTVHDLLVFDRTSILNGQVWRLVSFLLVPSVGGGAFGVLITFLLLFFYYRIGAMLENVMGVCKFNCFYFTGVVFLDIFGLIFDFPVYGDSLSLSLFAAFATLYPNIQILLMYIIPVKAKYLAWVYLGLTALNVVLFGQFYAVVPLLNYLIFFRSELGNLLPDKKIAVRKKQKPNPNWAQNYRVVKQQEEVPYRHKCTVCGRTNLSDPKLEFRYCSQCNGFYCYCMDHINNHVHIR